ncbi:LYR motif-containing 2 [Micractinium conductrix]|uniref:LYR motif-containing 2 n=1 Tax=Micractinium conductrix TaxID=554055 RepID=A0A2P6VSH4_9CHLO|nr:LYR motif-containing 2 [Micractinium conductrix]|eukprot:PSC77046.1 LYR motif-containing 2 [Micractinium conductrix]
MSELRGFILRQEVLHLYRALLRASKGAADAGTRVELRGEIRRQFDAQRVQQGDQAAVRVLLSDGKQKLKMLRETLAMQT